MKAKFIGDPNQPKGAETIPDEFTAFGVTFERGKFADVPEDQAHKFVGNNHFEIQGKEPEEQK